MTGDKTYQDVLMEVHKTELVGTWTFFSVAINGQLNLKNNHTTCDEVALIVFSLCLYRTGFTSTVES